MATVNLWYHIHLITEIDRVIKIDAAIVFLFISIFLMISLINLNHVGLYWIVIVRCWLSTLNTYILCECSCLYFKWCCEVQTSVAHVKNHQSNQPPCIAHYKMDILCAYKVGFRSPLYIPTMGDKAVFCARNMPLDLEDDFIRTLTFQFIPGWFPTRKRLNICGNAFYRPLVPFKEWP